jgi:hypothetical protein
VPSGGKFSIDSLEKISRAINTGTSTGAIFCRRNQQFEVETTPIGGTRKINVIANAFMERSVAATDR